MVNQISFPNYSINSSVDPSTWSTLSNLGNVYQKAQSDQARQSALSQIGTDAQKNMQTLLMSRDPTLVQAGLTMQQRAQDQAREDTRYGVTDRRADTLLSIQQAQEARAAAKDEEDTPQGRAKKASASGMDMKSPEVQRWIVGGGQLAAHTLTFPETIEQRKQAAIQLGLEPGTPDFQTYVLTEGAPTGANTIEKVKDANNNETLIRVPKAGPAGPIAGGAPAIVPNPLVGDGKAMNHDQAQAATYTDRMAKSHDILNGLEGVNQGFGSATGVVAEATRDIPYVDKVRNLALTSDRQKLEQAQRDFANAILRKESGAAISPSEFENARQQYFPQPGDSEEVIAQKQQNRLSAMRGMAREAGASYHPPSNIIPPEMRRPPSGAGAGADEALRAARNDLANRVPRAGVEAQLKAQGIDPSLIDPPTIKRTGTVNSGPNKGKTAIEFSDGHIEYK